MPYRRHGQIADIFTVGLISSSIIVFEIFLSRFFSAFLDHNYVFIVVSLATLGLGAGAFAASRYKWSITEHRGVFVLSYAALMIGISTAVYVTEYIHWAVYFVLFIIPFSFGGAILTNLFQKRREQTGRLYCADLVGAGVGAVGAILLMNALDPMRTIALISLILFANQMIQFSIFHKWRFAAVSFVLVILMGGSLFKPFWTPDRFEVYASSPFSVFYRQQAEVVYSSWDSFSKTDVYNADDEDFLYITIDGGAVSAISKFDGDLSSVNYLKEHTSYLAFTAPEKKRALIIGVGGGQDILTAKLAGFEHIEAVDINKGSFEAVQKVSEFAGDVMKLPGVETVQADGRNYVRKVSNVYDTIFLSLVTKKAGEGVGLALSENYIYTREAIGDYMAKLAPNGRLAFLLHDEKELAKILYAIEYVHHDLSQKQIAERVAIVTSNHVFGHDVGGDNELSRPLVIVKNEPFTSEESHILWNEAVTAGQNPMHVPHVYNEYSSIREYVGFIDIEWEANRDDRPFFYYKTSGIPAVLWVALLSSLALIAWFSLKFRGRIALPEYSYLAGIAIAFIIVEVTLIQTLTLPLGHPTLSFALVLGTLLTAGGLGSLWHERWGRGVVYKPLLWIFVSTLLLMAAVSLFSYRFAAIDFGMRVVAIGLLLIPIGFFMGMPFPHLLSRLKESQIPIAWGVNGLWTVVGSLLAAILSLQFGFVITLLLGGAIYAFLLPVSRHMIK